jgi:large subunit ribosomal protein L5
MNLMQNLSIHKVVVHMGVGESGEKLSKAEDVLKKITGQLPVKTVAKRTLPAFSIRKDAPIGCKVTLRGKRAEAFVQIAFDIVQRKLHPSQFDDHGNFSFGIEEHTDFPGMSYDPKIGIFGMDVNVALERGGARIGRRTIERRKIPPHQRITPQDAIAFMTERYHMEVK